MAYTTIDKGSSYFNTVLYTGNGSARSITGVGFKPDWVWVKPRSAVNDHVLADVVRGVTKTLATNLTAVELTNTNAFTAFNTDGFSLGTGTDVNSNTVTYASWNWLANGTGVSNTAGTITSTVSANTTSGFSVVSYTGTGANATVGHGLGVAPRMIILKSRTDSGADWRVYNASVGNTVYLELNRTTATTTSSTTWRNTTPTSTVFSIGTSGTVNLNTGSFIAYCFAEIRGYSKFGSYTGNGSADGTFVYTGFKPAMVLMKQSSAAGESWILTDNKRSTFNPVNARLFPNTSAVEATDDRPIDYVSNGFKIRTTDAQMNTSAATYIYMAFAENPFVTSTQIPTTAR